MDTLVDVITFYVVDLLLLTALTAYLINDRRIPRFGREVLLTGCGALIVSNMGWALYGLDIKPIRNSTVAIYAFSTTTTIGRFFLLFGLTLLVGRQPAGGVEGHRPAAAEPRHLGLSLLLFTVTLGLYFPFWLYRTVKDLRRSFGGDIPYTPARAVGFLFIPVLNVFWGLYILFSLPTRIREIEKKYFGRAVGFYFHPHLISILVLFLTILGQLPHSQTGMYWAKVVFTTLGIFVMWLTIQAKVNALFTADEAT